MRPNVCTISAFYKLVAWSQPDFIAQSALPAQPCFEVELRRLFAQLELENVVGSNRTKRLTGAYTLTACYAGRTEVGINGDIGAMTYHNNHRTAVTEHGANLSIVDASGLTAAATQDIDTLVVEFHILKSFYIILAKVAHDAVSACDGHG